MVKEHPVRKSDAQKAGIRILFICMSVVIPFIKHNSYLRHDFLILFCSHMPQIFSDSMGSKPLAADRYRWILFDLPHLIG